MPLKKKETQYPIWKSARLVPIAELDTTAYNPAMREEGNAMESLRKELLSVGIQMPILATHDGRVVDGHRRLHGMKANGETVVPVLFLAPNVDADDIWRAVNTSARPVSGAEWTQAYAQGLPIEYVKAHYRRHLSQIAELCGDGMINEMAMKKISARVLDQVNAVVRYVQREDDDEFKARCLQWMIEKRASYHVRNAITNGINPELLELAVIENRSLSPQKQYTLD